LIERIYRWLLEEGLKEFSDIIDDLELIRTSSGVPVKVRVMMIDNSFLEIYWSESGKYSLHYERRHIDGTIYRHDNAPHHKQIKTFPKHYHKGREDFVVESYLPDEPIEAVRAFLKEIREIIKLSS